MTIKYEPNYTNREAYYARKDRVVAERIAEKEKQSSLFARVRARLFPPAREPNVHDFRQDRWGHAANVWEAKDGGKTVTMTGHGCGIEAGDFIIKSNKTGWASYRVDKIEYKNDPPDMWFADCTWAPGVFEVRGGEIVRCENG